MDWMQMPVLVTGGASFIGSALVDELIERGRELRPEMPTGPMNRVADNSLARKLLGWEPQMKFMDGLHGTIDWYFRAKNREEVAAILKDMLTERTSRHVPTAKDVVTAD